MAKAVGIDLGTTNSAIAVVDELGRPILIPNKEGNTITPSAVLFRGNQRVVGAKAKNAAVAQPENVALLIKREMDNPDFTFTDASGNTFRPEELSAFILKKLKQDAEEALGEEITQAVITVPYYFGDLERQRTKRAGEIAGLEVLDIINEPTAAAIAHGINNKDSGIKTLVYDLGGGTFDITIMHVKGHNNLEVVTSNGDRALGGADFDTALSDYFFEQFEKEHNIDPYGDDPLRVRQDFLNRAELAKIDLSADTETDVYLSAAGKPHNIHLTRDLFENLIRHLVDQTEDLTIQALKDANLTKADIDKVLLVGGSTRIPAVRNRIKKLVGKEPETGFNPDEVVAMGAAIYAAKLTGKTVVSKTGQKVPAISFENVTAHSLGILIQDTETEELINSILIPKDSKIPAEGTKMYSTVSDNQSTVFLQILEGESTNPKHCTAVGDQAILTELPLLPKGLPQIMVTLSYDQSGIVHLKAKEMGSGRSLHTEIFYNSAIMTDREVQESISANAQVDVL